MGLGYAWEKAMVAVTGMACNPDSINERIASAYIGSLIRITPENDLPSDLRPLFEQISTALTEKEAKGNEGRVNASAREMSEDRATEVARMIVDLYDQLCARRASGES